jgi:hypothetical protein
VVLFGFEGPEGASGWQGLNCGLTNQPVSEGTQALRFVIPKFEAGGNRWPATMIDWNQGRGYAVKDWSHYAKLTFDAWIDGAEPSELAIELRDTPGKNGAVAKRLLQPGRKNALEVLLSNLAGADLRNIQEVLLWASRPARSFGVTVDNFRLQPGEKLPLVNFDLLQPNYREWVLPGAKGLKVSATLHPEEHGVNPRELRLCLTAVAGKGHVSSTSVFGTNALTASLPAARLPAGLVRLTAAVIQASTGQSLQARTWMLCKLTPAELGALKVYIDTDNNTIVDGQPFFPLGWFNNTSDSNLDEIADSPFNCVLDYGMNHVPKDRMLAYLDRARQKGLKVIYCLNDVYPTATYIDSWEGVTGNQPIADAVVDAYKDHPAVLAWYLNDELQADLEPRLEEYYQRVARADPNHPCCIVLCNMPELKLFPATTDIMGVDPYPIPKNPVTQVSDQAEVAKLAVASHKPVWVVPQAFGWYQYNSENKDRGHIPSAAELKEGRAPTYEEDRCMTYLALNHGAKGLIYYCYYDLRVLPQYREMWGWLKSIAAEVKALSPVLLSPDDRGTALCLPPNANVDTRLKQHEGKLYLIAVNTATAPCHVTFKLGGLRSDQAGVLFEGRSVKLAKAQMIDDFKPLAVHVYDLGRAPSPSSRPIISSYVPADNKKWAEVAAWFFE